MKRTLNEFVDALKDSDSTIQNMDTGATDLISKLKFIGRVQKGEKINVRHMYVQPDTWLNRISRTFFSNDNRTNTYNFIDSVISRSFDVINLTVTRTPLRSIDRSLVNNIVTDLKAAISGINNLRDTYQTDVMFCCKLDALVEQINFRLVDISETIEAICLINNPDEDVD